MMIDVYSIVGIDVLLCLFPFVMSLLVCASCRAACIVDTRRTRSLVPKARLFAISIRFVG